MDGRADGAPGGGADEGDDEAAGSDGDEDDAADGSDGDDAEGEGVASTGGADLPRAGSGAWVQLVTASARPITSRPQRRDHPSTTSFAHIDLPRRVVHGHSAVRPSDPRRS